jgi:hypothetical protein
MFISLLVSASLHEMHFALNQRQAPASGVINADKSHRRPEVSRAKPSGSKGWVHSLFADQLKRFKLQGYIRKLSP